MPATGDRLVVETEEGWRMLASDAGMSPTEREVAHDADEMRAALERLLSEADGIVDRLATRPSEFEARARELDELEQLRSSLVERTEAANERFGAAQRLIEQSRRRLGQLESAQDQVQDAIESANRRALSIVADAEAKAASVQAAAEREAIERIRRAERDAADRLLFAETEAQRIVAGAVAAFEDAERTAASAVAAVQDRVEEVVEEATRRRHAGIDQLHAHEREVEERIRVLLIDRGAEHLPRAEPSRWGRRDDAESGETVSGADPQVDGIGGEADPAGHADVSREGGGRASSDDSVIDLTDVSDAISEAIDAWVHRRSDG
ncbi:MAG: hypothetical protein AAGA37_15700 [Actinomycetota bacterium]